MQRSWNEDLSRAQAKAASHYGSHACLLAGPGTGKTLVITRHVLFLLSKQVAPTKIRVVTFTRRATAELRGRLREAIGAGSPMPAVSTLHSFALSTLLRAGEKSRLPQPLRIADDWEERWIIEKDLTNICNLNSIDEARDRLNDLSADWDCLNVDSDGMPTGMADPQFVRAWQDHRSTYGYTLRAEMVYQLKQALEQGMGLDGMIPEYLVVDEYQDLNPCELAVVAHLAKSGAELFVSGDDDQSIYGFRHARPQAIRDFKDEHAGAKLLRLEECYRCGESILKVAEYVISQVRDRTEKKLRCTTGACKGTVHVLSFPDQNEEARGVASLCKHLMDQQEVAAKEILILLRQDWRRAFSSVLVTELEKVGLPVNVATDPLRALNPGIRAPQDGRYLLAVLRLVAEPDDDLAWRTALQVRSRGVGPKTFARLNELAVERGWRFTCAMRSVCGGSNGVTRARDLREAVSNIERDVDNAKSILDRSQSVNEFISDLAAALVVDEALQSDVISTLQSSAAEMDLGDEADMDAIKALLRGMATSLGSIEQDADGDAVRIMTVHQAKGLSARAVFIVGAEDELMPGRATKEHEIDDERRLLYVSLTRAREYLYVTHCNRRTGQQSYQGRGECNHRRLTRFLEGAPQRSQPGMEYIDSL